MWLFQLFWLINLIYICTNHLIKAWVYEKIIFELVYLFLSFKIICILLRQVISLKKMVALSVKHYLNTILISWSPVSIPLILLSELIKLDSTPATILYTACRVDKRIKWSDRRPFILFLDLILVYATLIMWMNLSPYPNLCKAEKIKSTLRILQKDFYSVYLTHRLC